MLSYTALLASMVHYTVLFAVYANEHIMAQADHSDDIIGRRFTDYSMRTRTRYPDILFFGPLTFYSCVFLASVAVFFFYALCISVRPARSAYIL